MIDADELLEHIKKLKCNAENKKYEKGLNDFLQFYFPQIIDNQPTAFDTEKVVEQLEEYANGKICNMHRNCPYKDNDNIACENCGALGAIDIVKKGGVK